MGAEIRECRPGNPIGKVGGENQHEGAKTRSSKRQSFLCAFVSLWFIPSLTNNRTWSGPRRCAPTAGRERPPGVPKLLAFAHPMQRNARRAFPTFRGSA